MRRNHSNKNIFMTTTQTGCCKVQYKSRFEPAVHRECPVRLYHLHSLRGCCRPFITRLLSASFTVVQSVRDYETCASLHEALHSLMDEPFCSCVYSACGLIEYKHCGLSASIARAIVRSCFCPCEILEASSLISML